MDRDNRPNRENVHQVIIDRTELEMMMRMCELPMYTKNESGEYLTCSQSFYDFFGIRRPEGGVVDSGALFDAETRAWIGDRDRILFSQGGTQTYVLDLPHADGSLHQVEVTRLLIRGLDGKPLRIYGRMKDLTAEQRSRKERDKLIRMRDAVLEINNASLYSDSMDALLDLVLDKMLSLVEQARIGTVLFKNPDGYFVIRASRGYNRDRVGEFHMRPETTFLWRHARGRIHRTEIIDLAPEDNFDTPPLEHEQDPFLIGSSISAPIFIEGELYGLINVDSQEKHVFQEADREVLEFMRAQIEGVLNRQRLYERSKKQSYTDGLTQIDNRFAFESKLKGAMEAYPAFYLVMFDLDRLKTVNDTFGHEAGDRLLKLVAKQLDRLKADPRDVVARFGGDEFMGIFFREDRQLLLDELQALDEQFKRRQIDVSGRKISLTFSYGVAAYPLDGRQAGALIAEVDSRMYKYKRRQRLVEQNVEKDGLERSGAWKEEKNVD